MYINEFTNYLSDKIDDIVALASGLLEKERDIDKYPLEYDYLFHLGSLLNNSSDILYREIMAYMEIHYFEYMCFRCEIAPLNIIKTDSLHEFRVKIIKCATKISNVHKLRVEQNKNIELFSMRYANESV